MEYIKDNENYVLRLDVNEQVISSLADFASSESLQAGQIAGIGAVKEFTLGYYQTSEQAYVKDTYELQHELTNATGFITRHNQEPHIHLHATVADDNHQVFGGHLHEAKIAAAGEFMVHGIDTAIMRRQDSSLGLNLLHFNDSAQ